MADGDAAGSSGSTAAAPSPTSSAARRTATLAVHKLLVRQPGPLPGRRAAGHPRPARARRASEPLPAARIDAVKMGTTVATNALLERRGEPTRAGDHRAASATRSGSATSTARTSSRAASCCPSCSTPRWSRSTSGCAPTARCERPLDLERARADLGAAFAKGLRALAIVLVHGYRHHAHEAALAELARDDRLHPGLGQPSRSRR